MNNISTALGPDEGYPCWQCGNLIWPNIMHTCPTGITPRITETIHYQQKGVLTNEQYVPKSKYDLAVEALKKIIRCYGRVCQDFELCRHDACWSSSGAWFEAYEALEKLGEPRPDSEIPQSHVCHWHYVEVPVKRFHSGKFMMGCCCICQGIWCDYTMEESDDRESS